MTTFILTNKTTFVFVFTVYKANAANYFYQILINTQTFCVGFSDRSVRRIYYNLWVLLHFTIHYSLENFLLIAYHAFCSCFSRNININIRGKYRKILHYSLKNSLLIGYHAFCSCFSRNININIRGKYRIIFLPNLNKHANLLRRV